MDDDTFEEGLEAGAHLVRELAQRLPAVADLLREHEEDFDEILPTIFLNRVADWYVEAWQERETAPHVFEQAQRFAARLAARYPEASPAEENIIAVGFLEALPNPGAPGRDCVEDLPAPLRDERKKMDS
jgi:hypothetical protein